VLVAEGVVVDFVDDDVVVVVVAAAVPVHLKQSAA